MSPDNSVAEGKDAPAERRLANTRRWYVVSRSAGRLYLPAGEDWTLDIGPLNEAIKKGKPEVTLSWYMGWGMRDSLEEALKPYGLTGKPWTNWTIIGAWAKFPVYTGKLVETGYIDIK